MNSRASSTASHGMDGKDYMELETRTSDSYIDLEDKPPDSYPNGQRGPSNLDIDLKPPSSYLGLHDEVACSPRPTKGGMPISQPTNDDIYDDTLSPQNGSAGSNGPVQQDQGAFLQPPSCSPSSYPACNALPLNGTGRKGQALPEPPPEATMFHLNSFNTNYNTVTRQKATCNESASRDLAEAGHGFSTTSPRSCMCCRDVFWLFFGLAMTAACIGGCYYSTRIVVAQLCNSNTFSLDDASTTLYGEVEFTNFNATVNRTVFDPRFKNYVVNATQDTVISVFLKNVTVMGFTMDAARTRTTCRFTMTLQLHETKRRGLLNFTRGLLEEKFDRYSPGGATLQCLVFPTNEASTYSCPNRLT